MLLGQIKEIGDAAQRQLDNAAQMGSEMYILVLLVVLYSIAAGVHFWFIVRPDTEARRKSRDIQDQCLSTFASNYALQTQLMQEIDAHLSAIYRLLGAERPNVLRHENSGIHKKTSIHE